MLKTVSSLGNIIGALVYQGAWNASTNTPTLASGVGNKGDYYIVSVAGNTNLDGITDWQVGDFAVFSGTAWQKIDNTDAVLSVNGQTGVVVLTANSVGATPNTAYINAGTGLSGGGQLNGNVSIAVGTVPFANITGAVPDTRLVSAGGLLTGGGNLASDVTISLTNVPVANVPGAVPNTVNVIAGTGLSGGGALTGNVTLSVGTVPVANISGLGTMATQNADAVAITGGSINGAFVGNSNPFPVTGTYLVGTISIDGPVGNTYASPGTFTNVSAANVTVTNLANIATAQVTTANITTAVITTANIATANITTLSVPTNASATFATASLPLVPAGYLQFQLANATVVKIPYYAA